MECYRTVMECPKQMPKNEMIWNCLYHIYIYMWTIWSLFWIIPFDCSTGYAGSAGQRRCMAFGERSFSSRMTWAKWLAVHAKLSTCSACEMVVLPSSLSQYIYICIYIINNKSKTSVLIRWRAAGVCPSVPGAPLGWADCYSVRGTAPGVDAHPTQIWYHYRSWSPYPNRYRFRINSQAESACLFFSTEWTIEAWSFCALSTAVWP